MASRPATMRSRLITTRGCSRDYDGIETGASFSSDYDTGLFSASYDGIIESDDDAFSSDYDTGLFSASYDGSIETRDDAFSSDYDTGLFLGELRWNHRDQRRCVLVRLRHQGLFSASYDGIETGDDAFSSDYDTGLFSASYDGIIETNDDAFSSDYDTGLFSASYDGIETGDDAFSSDYDTGLFSASYDGIETGDDAFSSDYDTGLFSASYDGIIESDDDAFSSDYDTGLFSASYEDIIETDDDAVFSYDTGAFSASYDSRFGEQVSVCTISGITCPQRHTDGWVGYGNANLDYTSGYYSVSGKWVRAGTTSDGRAWYQHTPDPWENGYEGYYVQSLYFSASQGGWLLSYYAPDVSASDPWGGWTTTTNSSASASCADTDDGAGDSYRRWLRMVGVRLWHTAVGGGTTTTSLPLPCAAVAAAALTRTTPCLSYSTLRTMTDLAASTPTESIATRVCSAA